MDFGRPVDRDALARMSDMLRHRGPDDAGLEVHGPAGLGFRRLSIIDLAGSHQPMANEDKSLWLVFNGEVYNYRTLRASLQERGHRLATTGDGETILHLYEDHGLDFVHHLNGMFAIGIWDIPRQRLVLARDRLGVKPLYVARRGERLAFASETKALMELPWVQTTLDSDAIAAYLTFSSIPAPRTCFQGIGRLEPGHMAVFDRDGLNEHEYWDVHYRPRPRPAEEIVEEVESLLEDSVRLRMISDVPLGVSLSGGVDSGIISGMMAQQSSRPVEAFSIGYAGEATFIDELSHAQRVAEQYSMNHHVLRLEPADLLGDFERVVWFMDEPCGDPAAFLTLALSEYTRRHVTVSLSGLGGDELFAGYRRHLAVRNLDRYLSVPGFLRSRMIGPLVSRLPENRSNRTLNAFRKAKRFVRMADADPRRAWLSSVSYEPPYTGRILGDALLSQGSGLGDFDRHWERASAIPDPVDRVLYMDTKMYLADQLLLIQDKMSMAVSLEARVPFLDYRLVELAATIPSSAKLGSTRLKVILKRLAERYIPKDCIYRPKQGFGMPLDLWLRGALREPVYDLLTPSRVRDHGVFQVDYVEWLKREFYERNRELTIELYHVFLLETWLQLFVDRPRAGTSAVPAATASG